MNMMMMKIRLKRP